MIKKVLTHRFIVSVLIIGALGALVRLRWIVPLNDVIYAALAPVQNGVYSVAGKTGVLLSSIGSIKNALQENIELKERNLELSGEVARLGEVAKENDVLRRQMGMGNAEERKLVLADIVGRDVSNLTDCFIINKGERDGVRKKDIVVAAGNILVGLVVEASDSYARVRSVTDPSSRINALIQGTMVSGIVRGGDNFDLIFDLIPQDALLVKGEQVVTSGLADPVISGLVIGEISKIISKEVQMSQSVRLKQAVSVASLKQVFIILQPVLTDI